MKHLMIVAVAVSLAAPALGQIEIPAPAGTIKQIGAAEREGLIAAVSAIVHSGRWESGDSSDGYNEFVYAPELATAETPVRLLSTRDEYNGYLREVYARGDAAGDAARQALYSLRFRMRLFSDGSLSLRWLQVEANSIAVDGTVSYTSPYQLQPESQKRLAQGVVHWSAWGRAQASPAQ